ncbi:hypothetical protein CF326_g5221 [Tilletia indica]|nr:hypothetical protein CF326_g5221 [Tilletia indica]
MSPQDPSDPPAPNRDSQGNVALSLDSYVAIMNRLSELEARQDASESSQGSSQSSNLSLPTESQAEALSQLQMNAQAGPSAPPVSHVHRHSEILTNWRRIIYARAGIIDTATHIWELEWPRASMWPKHPATYEADDSEPVAAGLPGGQVLIRQLRANFAKPFRHEVNQSQFRPTWTYMLSNRRAFGIPVDMTREQLVKICAVTFEGWQRKYRESQTPEGRARREAATKRSVAASRTKRKADSRRDALQMNQFFFFNNGSKTKRSGATSAHKRSTQTAASDLPAARRGAVRADVEFAVQTIAMSDEDDDWEDFGDGTGREARRRLGVPWRSAELIAKLEEGDKRRMRNRQLTIFPPKAYKDLPVSFVLPSNVRRWMVSESWATAHPSACLDVSDNAGPYKGPFAVARGQKEWGRSYDGINTGAETDDSESDLNSDDEDH